MIFFSLNSELANIRPMIIGVWYGESKPVVNEYLERFVAELKNILPEEIHMNAKCIKVKFGLVICDTPARSMIKGIPISIVILEVRFILIMK